MTELDKDNFDATVLAHKGVYLVDFWSETCDTCIEMMPAIETLAADLEKMVASGDEGKVASGDEGKVAFGRVNLQGNRRLAIREKVMSLPTIAIYRDGERVASFSKEFTTDQVRAAVRELTGG